jgi:hypothetical protein
MGSDLCVKVKIKQKPAQYMTFFIEHHSVVVHILEALAFNFSREI